MPGEFEVLFAASAVLPCQYSERDRGGEYARVHLATLSQAIVDLAGGGAQDDFVERQERGADAADAAEWIANDDWGAFSFNECCEILSLNPEAARKALAALSVAHQLERLARELDLDSPAPSVCAISSGRHCREGHLLTPGTARVARNGEGNFILRCNICDAAYQRAHRLREKARRPESTAQGEIIFPKQGV